MPISLRHWFAMTLVAGVGVGISSVALAHVDVGVNIGIPGAVYAPEPEPVYAPPSVYVESPPPVVIGPGWYGERYYDGHRYWQRHEWEERHRDEREWHYARDHYDGYHLDWDHDRDDRGPRGNWHHDYRNGYEKRDD